MSCIIILSFLLHVCIPEHIIKGHQVVMDLLPHLGEANPETFTLCDEDI